jgi:hypothetical protein
VFAAVSALAGGSSLRHGLPPAVSSVVVVAVALVFEVVVLAFVV